MKKLPLILVGVFTVLVLGIIYFVDTYNEEQDAIKETSTSQQSSDSDRLTNIEDKNASSGLSSELQTEKELLYLIEEEKLAHDVYTVMYEKYGAKVFGNILESESTHQERVLTLLNARNIPDPRSSELGVFVDSDLQKFYDDLISQGNTNETEAYKVGVVIEETDIADLSAQLATATDQDVIEALEDLRRGSENHLRAFNKQL